MLPVLLVLLYRRQGLGVTGGNPFGFDVGQPRDAPGSALPGIDLGVRGMRVGGQRRLLVPPSLVSGDGTGQDLWGDRVCSSP